MKKVAAAIVSLLFALSLAGISFAQAAPAGGPPVEKAKGEDKAAKPGKKAEAKKTAPLKKTAKPAEKGKKEALPEAQPKPKSQVQQPPAKTSALPDDVQREMGADVVIDIPRKK
jgi:hypothetical protein